MNWRSKSSRTIGSEPGLAFTLVELLILVLCLAIAAIVLLPALPTSPNRSPRINCTNNLKQIGLSFSTWASDHNDRFPMQVSVTNGGCLEVPLARLAFISFEVTSNELSTPKLLICIADSSRIAAERFTKLGSRNLSYFLGVDASSTNPNMLLAGDDNLLVNDLPVKSGLLNLTSNSAISWSGARHGSQGNVCLADGSVQQFSRNRLVEALANTGSITNRILFP